jgi:pilus assembly protein CpaC
VYHSKKHARATRARHLDRTHKAGRRTALRSLLVTLALALPVLGTASLAGVSEAKAQRMVSINGAKRTALVSVSVGKTEDVRTDASFVDILVGDPEIADVNPLTDHSLSILGRKNGTTRVSVYADGKKLVGVFDVEVTQDTSILAAAMARRFPHASLKVSSVNGRVMLSGSAPDAATVDKAVTLARQFGGEVINSVFVTQPQQVMLEVRFIEASRQAGRELGVQWNGYSNNGRFLGNIGNRVAADQLPVTNGTTFMQPNATTPTAAGKNVPSTGLTISPIVAAGVLSGTAPFGFLIGKLISDGISADIIVNALEQRGMARTLAEPNLVALSGDTASFLAGGEFPIPVPGALGQVSIETSATASGLPSRRLS